MNLLDLDDLMELLQPSQFMMGVGEEGPTQLPWYLQKHSRKPAISGPPEISGDEQHFTPLMDVCESETERIIHIDLPGVRKEDLSIELKEDNKLWVTGFRKMDKSNQFKFLHHERHKGRFRRRITIPEHVKDSDIKASIAEGILTISFPKPQTQAEVPASKERKIHVS